MSAEFFCLGDGAARELQAGDASRETNVVLYLRARARLPTGKVSFDHDGVQAFRSRVNRRRQPGWTTTNDGDITNA
jgi:hypothetical protein